MRWIVTAFVLLLGQLFFDAGASDPPSSPLAVERLLDGRNSTPSAVALAGRVVEASPTWGDGVRLTMAVETADGEPAEGLLSVSLRETTRRWRTGDRLALRSRLRRINGFGNFGELDWAAYNARRGIFAGASAWNADDVEALAPRDGVVERLRRAFSEACERTGGQGAEILEALVIGDRTGIDRDTNVAVRDAGLAHFLAISGSHMALIVALVVALVRRAAGLSLTLLERYDVMRAAAVAAALAVVAYGAVCGGGVSVVRSELMALAAMAALWRGRPGDDLRALGGSAIAIALAMPGVGEEAGFQLSYLAVAALVMDSRRARAERREARLAGTVLISKAAPGPLAGLPGWAARGLHFLLEAARLTLVCWVVTSPIVAHHFQRISLVAPLANLLAAPLVSAIVVSGIAGLVLLPVSTAGGDLAVRVGSGLSEVVIAVSAWCASLPMAATVTPAPGIALAATLTALALVALLPRSPGRRRAAVTLAVVAAGFVVHGVHGRYRSDRLDVWFASVGQGDAAIVRLPGGPVWVIDQGPPGRGRMVVGPLLRRAWIGRVDVLVASHLQSDHSGALVEILEEFDVGEIWIPDGPCDGEAGRALLDSAAARGVPVRLVSADGRREFAGGPMTAAPVPAAQEQAAQMVGPTVARSEDVAPAPPAGAEAVTVLWPPRGAARCNANNQSLVLSVSFGGRRVLFTGDIESAGEARVAELADARADVLKVAHHGSRTSSTAVFLDAVKPSLAVASVGLDNMFHHPAPDVVARYDARAIPLLRTDRDGAVHLVIGADGAMGRRTFREASGDRR